MADEQQIIISENKVYKLDFYGKDIAAKLSKIKINSDKGTTEIADLVINDINNIITNDNKLNGDKIANNSINANDTIINDSIFGSKLHEKAINTRVLDDQAVTTEKIKLHNITDDLIQDGGLNSVSIKDRAINKDKIAIGCVTGGPGGHIKANSITGGELSLNCISTNNIIDGAVTNGKLAGNISGSKITTRTITNDRLSSDGKISFVVNGAVKTIELGGKLEDSLSTATNIKNGYGANSIYQQHSAYAPVETAIGAVVFGNSTSATPGSSYQAVFGQYNANNQDALLIVGNGSSANPKNIFEVYDDGTTDGYSGIKLYDKTNNTMLGMHLNAGELYFNDNQVVTLQHNRLAVPAITNFSTVNGIIAACDEINAVDGKVNLQKVYSMLDKSSLTIKGSATNNLQAQIMLTDTNGSSATIKATTTNTTANQVFTLPETGGTIITDTDLKSKFDGYRYKYTLSGTVLTILKENL